MVIITAVELLTWEYAWSYFGIAAEYMEMALLVSYIMGTSK